MKIFHESVSVEQLTNSQFTFYSDHFKDEILIYFYDSTYFAISTFCPHFGGPLKLESGKISCHWHGWEFGMKTHKCVNRKVDLAPRMYKVNLEKNILKISYENNI